MDKEQAEALADEIRQQLPFRRVEVQESLDTRNAPANYFIAITRGAEILGQALIIHSRFEWDQALLAWDIIRD